MFYLRRERLGSSDVGSSARRRAVVRRTVLPFPGIQQGFGKFQGHPGCPQDP